jgi:hypothetical protein
MKILFTSVLFTLIALSSGCFFLNRGGERGEVFDKWETANQSFKIRVTEYAEKNPVVLTHFFYVFEVFPAGSDGWHKITAVRTDDDIPIPRESVRFVNVKTGYFFMSSKYAVTTDTGHTWTVLDAEKDLPDWQTNGTYIKEVQIAPDGSGTMTLPPFAGRKGYILKTTDYGQHWSVD